MKKLRVRRAIKSLSLFILAWGVVEAASGLIRLPQWLPPSEDPVNATESSSSDLTAVDLGSWEPSDQWIESCVQRQNETSRTYERYSVTWPRYRLGDCVRMCFDCHLTVRASQFKELSIAGEYWYNVCQKTADRAKGNNLTFLDDLFHRYERINPYPYDTSWSTPEEDELVIHLRVGDVMGIPKYVGNNASVIQMLRNGLDITQCCGGIGSIREYLSIIQKSGLTKVVLKGGSHIPAPWPKSRIYTQCLADAIRTAGYNLTTKVDGEDNPDQDFYYMSHAKYFVQATGGYSELIATLVKRWGGTVLEREFYPTNNLTNF